MGRSQKLHFAQVGQFLTGRVGQFCVGTDIYRQQLHRKSEKPWALGRENWLFAGSLRSGQRAAALMSLIQSAKLDGHDAYAYLKDVITRLPSEIGELLPHRWQLA